MRQKLIPCFLATVLVFTGAIGASLLTADPAFAVVDALTAGPTEGAGGSKLHFDGRVAIRGEYRNNANFGSDGTSATNNFVVQNTQLGVGYDITPDLGFYILMQDSRTWGGSDKGTATPTGGLGFNTAGNISGSSFGIREGYITVNNFGAKGLKAKIGRQKLVFGNQRMLGHFDWSNVGWSFDGVRFDYASSDKSNHTAGWFRNADDDCSNSVSLCGGNAGGTGAKDSDFFLFYNTFKQIPKHTIEPYYIWVFDERTNTGFTTGGGGVGGGGSGRTQPDQQRHMLGLRVHGNPSIVDYTLEYVYQTGRQENGLGGRNNINAMAVAANFGVTLPVPMKPRIAMEADYATGSGANRNGTGGRSTFENFWPTNHLHYGYMDLMGWKNMFSFGPQFSVKPSKNGTFKVHFWWHRLADADDDWYGAGQGPNGGGSVVGNDEKEIGQELDIVYVHKFFGGASTLNLGYGHFFTGDYISKSGGGSGQGAANINDDDDQDWGYLWWITKF
jgi:hypothetical protein